MFMTLPLAIFLVAFVIAGIIFRAFRKESYFLDNRFQISGLRRIFFTLGIAILAVLINPIDVERIDAGHVGIKVSNVGDDRGVGRTEYVTGWVFYNSWISRIFEFPIHQQHIEYEEADIVTKGGFRAMIKPSFNYSINPGNVADMFQNLRVGV